MRERRHLLPTIFASALLLACAGCPSEPPQPPASVEPSKPQAEVRFDRIMEDLTRHLSTTSDRRERNPSASGGDSGQWSQQLTHKIRLPKEESDRYQATITITRRSSFTVFARKKKTDEAENDTSSRTDDELTGLLGGGSEDGIDPALLDSGSGGGGSLLSNSSPIKTQKLESVTDFHLEYVNNRWQLLTEPDPETQGSIELAFEYALKRQ